MSEVSSTRCLWGKTGKRKKTAGLRVNDDSPFQPERNLRKIILTGYMKRTSNSAN
jgi:hypothetical protein